MSNNYKKNNTKTITVSLVVILIAVILLNIYLYLSNQNSRNEYVEDTTINSNVDVITEQENGQQEEQSYEVELVEVPDWYIVGQVAVKGNQVCFSRDDGLIMENDVMPTTVTVYTSDDSGKLIDMTEYIVFESEELAKYHCERLNNYEDGTNSFGMSPGEAAYYYCENIMLEVFDKNYYQKKYETLQDVIDMYAGYGWLIKYL